MAESPAPLAAPAAPSSRLLVALIVGQLGLHSVMAGLRLGAPLQALREGYSPWTVGILLALFAAAPVLTAMPAGRLADRKGYHAPTCLAVGLALLGAALAVASTWLDDWPHFVLLCLAASATGAGANIGMLTLQRTAGLAARDATERVRVFSWLGVAPSFANVVGPVAVGFLIDWQGFRAAYLMLLVFPLVTLWAAWVVPRVRTAAPASGPKKRAAMDLLNAPGFKRLLVVNWLLSTCWDVHSFAVPVLGHERGFSASTIGLILGTFTLTVTAVRLFIPLLAHRVSEVKVVRWAMLATGLVFVIYPLAPSPFWMGVCAAFLGISLGCVQPMLMAVLHHLTPDHRHGEALALRSMAINGASTVMPLIFGATGTLVGAALLFWMVGGAVGAGAWLTRQLPALR